MTKPLWVWPDSELVAIIDGDTITANLKMDIGFGGFIIFPTRLRLNRIDAFEHDTAKGKLAKAAVQSYLGNKFRMETIKPYKYGGNKDSPGEWMVEVYLDDKNTLSDWMVEQGHALYWDGKGKSPARLKETND